MTKGNTCGSASLVMTIQSAVTARCESMTALGLETIFKGLCTTLFITFK